MPGMIVKLDAAANGHHHLASNTSVAVGDSNVLPRVGSEANADGGLRGILLEPMPFVDFSRMTIGSFVIRTSS
jgi:hypothetical protein